MWEMFSPNLRFNLIFILLSVKTNCLGKGCQTETSAIKFVLKTRRVLTRLFSLKVIIQFRNDWYTLQKLTITVFAFRHWENLDTSYLRYFSLLAIFRCVIKAAFKSLSFVKVVLSILSFLVQREFYFAMPMVTL